MSERPVSAVSGRWRRCTSFRVRSETGSKCFGTARRKRYGPCMDKNVPRAHHDLGGVSKFLCEPVDVEPHALTDFDKEVDALRAVLGMKRVMTVDELRRGIEAIPEAEYHRLSYYRRWIRSIADNLLVKGVITEAELRAALDRV